MRHAIITTTLNLAKILFAQYIYRRLEREKSEIYLVCHLIMRTLAAVCEIRPITKTGSPN